MSDRTTTVDPAQVRGKPLDIGALGSCPHLATKLAEIMGEVERVEKTGKMSGTGPQYKFATVGDILDYIRPMLSVRRVATTYKIVHGSQRMIALDKGWGCELLAQLHFTCADTGETDYSEAYGFAIDTYDKAANKAMTAAIKYAYIDTFGISTGDDPDKSNGHNGNGHHNEAPHDNGSRPAPAPANGNGPAGGFQFTNKYPPSEPQGKLLLKLLRESGRDLKQANELAAEGAGATDSVRYVSDLSTVNGKVASWMIDTLNAEKTGNGAGAGLPNYDADEEVPF